MWIKKIVKSEYVRNIIRFFDLIALTYIVFDFGVNIRSDYKEVKFYGLLFIVFGWAYRN